MTNQSLSQRLRKANAMLIASVVILGITAIGSLIALRINTNDAIEEYREMMMLKHAENGLERAELELHVVDNDWDVLERELDYVRDELADFVATHMKEANEGEVASARERSELIAARTTYSRVVDLLNQIDSENGEAPQLDVMSQVIGTERIRLRKLAVDPDLGRVQRQASRETWLGVIIVAVISLVLIAMVIRISRELHRRIVGSIQQLQAGTREIARGHFSKGVKEQGDEEIVALARDFNKMRVQLDVLYRDMERQIELKSRELVRSERLASVGFLAAGVAHEINNPLGIINGYATMARKWLSGTPGKEQIAESSEAFKIIGEEAFRCKKIVEQLVTLSMVGNGSREPVSLRRVVEDLIRLVQGLERSQSRHIDFADNPDEDPDDQYMVMANPVELKQVVLNLIVNALDATEEHTGRVTLLLSRSRGKIHLCVQDNGCGIDAEKLDNVFEPFFSRHSNGENHRLGLGLTISHAIVEAHHGSLRVRSDGIGRGSRFIVDLPDDSAMETIHEPVT